MRKSKRLVLSSQIDWTNEAISRNEYIRVNACPRFLHYQRRLRSCLVSSEDLPTMLWIPSLIILPGNLVLVGRVSPTKNTFKLLHEVGHVSSKITILCQMFVSGLSPKVSNLISSKPQRASSSSQKTCAKPALSAKRQLVPSRICKLHLLALMVQILC